MAKKCPEGMERYKGRCVPSVFESGKKCFYPLMKELEDIGKMLKVPYNIWFNIEWDELRMEIRVKPKNKRYSEESETISISYDPATCYFEAHDQTTYVGDGDAKEISQFIKKHLKFFKKQARNANAAITYRGFED
jgi:hypothetical protein